MPYIEISGEGVLKGVSEASQENQPQQSIRSRHDPCAYHKRLVDSVDIFSYSGPSGIVGSDGKQYTA